jgi:DNA damage-binding protein 1
MLFRRETHRSMLKVSLFSWGESSLGGIELSNDCNHHGHILALYLTIRGDFIIVGDLMKSISLLQYQPTEEKIVEIARDYNTNWMTAVEALDDDVFIGSENGFNIFTVQKNSETATDEDRKRLDMCGWFHTGEFINRFRHGKTICTGFCDVDVALTIRLTFFGLSAGSLVVTQNVDSDSSPVAQPRLIFAAVSGMIGVVASISEDKFLLLQRLEQSLAKYLLKAPQKRTIGNLTQSEWRSFTNDRRVSYGNAKNFIDGDLIEQFLDLQEDAMWQVVDAVNSKETSNHAISAEAKVSVQEITKLVEDLTRIH